VVISRRSLLLAGAAIPASAYGQCVTDRFTVDACRGGVRGSSGPPGQTLDLNFMFPGTLDPRITFTRASSATYTDASGVIQTAATNAPRWDYDPVTHALRGLLIEEQRTNNLLWSTDFGNAVWVEYAGAIKGAAVTGPDAASSGRTVTLPNGGQIYQLVTIGIRTFMSVYARARSLNQFAIRFSDGTVSAALPLTAQWRRFVVAAPVTAANVAFTTVGADAGTMDLAMPQLEIGDFGPTSYIPTTSAAVTRAADVATMPTNVSWYNATTYSLMCEMFNLERTDPVSCGISLPSDFSNAAFFGSQYWQTAGVVTGSAGVLTLNTVSKMCGTLNTATKFIKVAVNGQIGTGNALTTTPAAGSLLSIGSAPWDVSGQLGGHIRRINYWNRVLSDTEMQQVTT